MISKAIMFANLAYSNQKRKGTEIPYIMHPLEAGVIVSQMKFDENLISAAILHDTAEDAHVGYETLKSMFNERIADLVKSQSEDKSKTWKERKQHTIEYLKSLEDEDIKIVSLADKLSNIRSLHRDYLVEKENLWKRFNVKEKNEHGWYYRGLVESLNDLSNYKEYKEFKELVFTVFGDLP
jgi:GTP diphosphokinase / guanosine-3',5'-bis(diphosphate) 3'-diphosphatase